MEAGRRIGKYVLDERIAVGGMAEVWAARAEGPRGFVKPVALKFILESFSGDPELERLFVNEARIAARLQHANLVTVFDFDKVDADQERGLAGRYYIAMERVEGQDLRRIGEAARRAGYVFPIGVALYVAGEMLKALRYVHDKREHGASLGLVHRDVSPHNVLVGTTGEVKLSDFGIAKAREHSARNTKPGNLRGKIAYASPEQLAGGVVDHRTDQFAAGVTLWELFAGRKLFDGASDLEIIGKVARCEIPPLGDTPARRDVPPAVEAVLRRMLAAEPAARFPTTAEALSAVLALAGYTPDGAPLGELVRALFPTGGATASHTLPLQALTPARAALAETRTMHAGASAPTDDGRGTPTRHAKRTSEALARSPAAAGDVAGTTADVRAGRGRNKVVVALAVGVALGAVVLALQRSRGVSASPGPTSAVAPVVVVSAAPPVLVAPAPRATPSADTPPSAPAPRAMPSADTPPSAPAPRAMPTSASPSRADSGSAPAAVGVTSAAPTNDHHHATRRRHDTTTADAPVLAPPPRAAAPAPRSSPNGAPIIE